MPRTMDDAEWRAFVSEGTRTGKLATTRHDGRPHVVPIWFVLDGDDFVFNTGAHSIKGRALARNGIAALCVDDERPPYAFVSVTGTVTITTERDDLRRWATAIGARYMGADARRGVRGAQRGRRRAAGAPARRPRPGPDRHRGVRMTAFHIAQLNIGRARGAVDGPIMAEFMALLDPVNAVADASPGFVWRLQTEEGNATALRPYEDDRMIVNMSVWESIEDLAAFVYRSGHVDVMRRRREWFEPMKPYMVLWWVPAGAIPTVDEAKERLDAPARQRTDALRVHLQGALPRRPMRTPRSSSTTTCAARPERPRAARRRKGAAPTAARGSPSPCAGVVDRDRREARVGQQRRAGRRSRCSAQPARRRRRAEAPTPPRA